MRDTPENDRSHLLHTARPTPARQRTPGEHVWTLTKDGRRVDCELRHHGDLYGWECQWLTDGELASARRVGPCSAALRQAETQRQRLLAQDASAVVTPPVDDRGIPRRRPKGEEVWRLRHPDGERVQACEICDDNGWTVLMLENGEPLFARGCADEREARDVARIFRQDTVRAGWG